jgi:hypothetical protein
MRNWMVGIALLVTGLLASAARAERDTNFTMDFGLGYAKVNIDGANASDLDGNDTSAAEVRFKFTQPKLGNWRLGFALNVVDTWEDTDPYVIDGKAYIDDPYKEFYMLSPMFSLGYQVPLGSHWFIEPSVAVGPSIGVFILGEDHGQWWDDDNAYDDHVRVGVAVQPALQVGYEWDHFGLGAEVSYLWTHLDFGDDIGGDISVFYAGGFFRWSF